jgi:hypothetical protein
MPESSIAWSASASVGPENSEHPETMIMRIVKIDGTTIENTFILGMKSSPLRWRKEKI